jgi:nucleoside-diphosphate-sugar epimerase
MSRILCIGSEGNIGSKLVPYLRSQNHEVFRCDQAVGNDYQVCNIISPLDLLRVFDEFNPEVVYLLAAMVSRVTCEKSPELTINTNLSGLNNIIELCKIFNSKLIYFSTSEVYGNIGGKLSEDRICEPNNLYGLTKYLGEKLVQYELNDAIIVRPFMFYDEDETIGDHRSAMIRFAYHLSRKERITVHKGSTRSWMHISDGVKVLERMIYVTGPQIINVGSLELINTEDLAYKMCVFYGIKYSDYVIEEELPDKMTLEKTPDIRKQIELTGIIPEISINEGIRRVCNKFAITKNIV